MGKHIDITGNRFGKLTVLGKSQTRRRGILSWECLCDCGNKSIVAGVDLRNGDTKSCGCAQYKGSPKDITSKRFGKLIAEYCTENKSKNGTYFWSCRCDCGNNCLVNVGNLNSGGTTSCGCARNDAAQMRRKYPTEISKSKILRTWNKIKDRCYNKMSSDYENYGGKGIIMDDFFLEDFMNFYAEIGMPPDNTRLWSVDRIDHTKNYEPGNIRWATDAQQSRNRGKMKNNTSGVTGVGWDEKSDRFGVKRLYAKAQWKCYDAKGNQRNMTKCFSVGKYGLIPAFALAVQYREEKIRELNENGYGYSGKHGK